MAVSTRRMNNPVSLSWFYCTLHLGYSSPPWFYVILLHFSPGRSNWYSPSFSSTTFQNFTGISDLLFEVSEFQHHTQLCSKCSALLVSSLNLSPICWWKEILCWMLLLPVTILDFISRVPNASLVIMRTKSWNITSLCR